MQKDTIFHFHFSFPDGRKHENRENFVFFVSGGIDTQLVQA